MTGMRRGARPANSVSWFSGFRCEMHVPLAAANVSLHRGPTAQVGRPDAIHAMTVPLPDTLDRDNPDVIPSGPMAVLASRSRDMTVAEAEALVLATYGLRASAAPLRSERDQNFLMTGADGGQSVFKLGNTVQDEGVSTLQTRALQHIAGVDPDLPVPRVVPTQAGAEQFRWTGGDGAVRIGRMVSFVPGVPLADQPRTAAQAVRFGTFAARLGRALRGFFDPAAGHELLWDLKHAAHLADMLPCIEAERDRQLATVAIDRFRSEVLPRLPSLRGQVIHNDLNPHNILVDPAAPDEPCGIIDFGDMVFGALISDVAVAMAYLVIEDADPLALITRFVAAYHALTPLDAEEITLLPDLIAARHAMTSAISAWRARRYPENATYIVRNRSAAVVGLEALSTIGSAAVAARLLDACGLRR